jgi:hypothetical protein
LNSGNLSDERFLHELPYLLSNWFFNSLRVCSAWMSVFRWECLRLLGDPRLFGTGPEFTIPSIVLITGQCSAAAILIAHGFHRILMQSCSVARYFREFSHELETTAIDRADSPYVPTGFVDRPKL